MDTIDGMKGRLDLALGGGWISRHEASTLEAGRIIRSDRLAGTGQELRFNGERFASCDVLVVGEGKRTAFCPRVSSLEGERSPGPEPVRGEEATELLPFSIRMGSAEARLSDLSGLGKRSVIDMGIDAARPENGILLISGHEAARGVVCVVGENMGLRITEVLARTAPGAEFRTTGNLLEAGYAGEKIADYDFSRPDFFTRAELEGIEEVHADFLRSLTAALPGALGGLRLACVDQLNFREFLDALPAEGGSLLVAPTSPARAREETRLPTKPILRLSTAPFPEERILSWMRKDAMRGSGAAVFAEGTALGTGTDGEDGSAPRREAIFAALRDAWKRRGSLAPVPSEEIPAGPGAFPAALAPWVDEYEMIALASFKMGDAWALNIAYPARALEPVMKALSR